ncbi:putative serpin A13 isoform X2 [Fukomys damarensis]|uniref:putative serpin A13 isoform X2 n=1 Tax=Fukomys damarensis TaxID=885580 RepID=UPI00053F48DB|nr:putative serpin A13 isoform X2 [Fukomys damarensis]
MPPPRLWLLVTALLAAAHRTALAHGGDSGLLDPGPQDSPPWTALPCHKISVSNIDFAFTLYRQLARDSPRENILFSPASISTALASISLRASAASRVQLLEALGFNLTMVTEAEVQDGFRDLLLRLPVQGSGLLLSTGQRRFGILDPGATLDLKEAWKNMDEHIDKQTQGKFGTWGKDVKNETTEVLVNHVLLRAGWAQPFDPRGTSLRGFSEDEHRAVQVPMMKQQARVRVLRDPELQCGVLQMDHARNTTSFFVFPDPGTMGQLEEALQPETLIKWDSLLRTSSSRLELLLPLVAVGGSFPGQPALHVSKVTHQARMTVDEDGTEAAAATVVQLTPRPHLDSDLPAPPGPAELSRPFLVMTFHTETGSMLFLGKVVNPQGSAAPDQPGDSEPTK